MAFRRLAHEVEHVGEGSFREATGEDRESALQLARFLRELHREIELATDPGTVRTNPSQHGGQRVLERARRVAGGVGPCEHFVAHGPHGELADRGDQTEGDIEGPELEGKALRGS